MISRRERLLSLAGALGVPFGIGLFLLSIGAPQRLLPPGRDIALFDVAAANPVPAPKPQPNVIPEVKPAPVAPPEMPAVIPLPAEVVSLLAEASEQAGVCDLTAPVQAALQADPEVADAVARLPRDARSVANAIMVWNDVWFPSDAGDADVLPAVREVIVTTVGAATPECREANQGGPRFLNLGDAEATVVALGSEDWRWQDLVDTAAAQPVMSASGRVVPYVG